MSGLQERPPDPGRDERVEGPSINFVREGKARTCVFCRDDVLEDEESATCGECGALYHDDCLSDELEGFCASLGCGRIAPRRRLRQANRLRARLRRRRRRRLLHGSRQREPGPWKHWQSTMTFTLGGTLIPLGFMLWGAHLDIGWFVGALLVMIVAAFVAAAGRPRELIRRLSHPGGRARLVLSAFRSIGAMVVGILVFLAVVVFDIPEAIVGVLIALALLAGGVASLARLEDWIGKPPERET